MVNGATPISAVFVSDPSLFCGKQTEMEHLGSRFTISPVQKNAEGLGCEHAEGTEEVSTDDYTGTRS